MSKPLAASIEIADLTLTPREDHRLTVAIDSFAYATTPLTVAEVNALIAALVAWVVQEERRDA